MPSASGTKPKNLREFVLKPNVAVEEWLAFSFNLTRSRLNSGVEDSVSSPSRSSGVGDLGSVEYIANR